jgi:hypothetical protein
VGLSSLKCKGKDEEFTICGSQGEIPTKANVGYPVVSETVAEPAEIYGARACGLAGGVAAPRLGRKR